MGSPIPVAFAMSLIIDAMCVVQVGSAAAPVANVESYLCVANMTTRFNPDKITGMWTQANFN